MSLTSVGEAMGTAIGAMGQYSAQAAARANGVSAAAQRAQGAFNQSSVNNANSITADRISQQYGFNSAQAAMANQFTQDMWNQSANWNESMWNKSADWNERMWDKMASFNAEQAQINRDWQEKMMSTAYQRAVKDMESAGLNPILAVTGGGISTGSGSGSAASVGGASIGSPSMSGANGYAANGGLPSALAASEGNYTGQMEYMGGWLGLLSAGIAGLSSAFKNFGTLGDLGASFGSELAKMFSADSYKSGAQIAGENILNRIRKAAGGNAGTTQHSSSSYSTHGGSSGTFESNPIWKNRR